MLPGPLLDRAVRAAASRADLVIVPSRAVGQELGGSARPVVVHPGVALERFASEDPPAQPPEVLVLGALVGWKRPDLALEICALARRTRPDLRLRFVGAPFPGADRSLLDALRARAARPDLAGAVEFAGTAADPAADLTRASALLHCADREPFGVAVVEALAAARPAIVPAAAGPTEIVDDSCAIMYPPGDSGTAARGLLRVLEDPELAAAMGRRGRARARARFSLDQSRARFAEALAPLMPRPPESSWPADGLALITVTHNSADELSALLRSVERYLPGCHVVVVDCASRDGTVALARDWPGPRPPTVLALAENVGFGTASNAGVAAAREPVSVLLNPDVELLDDSLLRLAEEALREDRPDRLLAPLVLSPDGSRQDSVHPAPTSTADLVRALVPPGALPAGLGARLAPWRSRRPQRVGWAVGCAVLARTETLRRLGPFDERIFMFGEDLDLGLRAAQAGIPTWFRPEARVLHHGAHATTRAFDGEPFDRLAAARHDVVARQLGARRARLDDLAQAVTFGSRIALKRVLGLSADRERQQLQAVRRRRRTESAGSLA
jgi:GT2 family glycosyltransferase